MNLSDRARHLQQRRRWIRHTPRWRAGEDNLDSCGMGLSTAISVPARAQVPWGHRPRSWQLRDDVGHAHRMVHNEWDTEREKRRALADQTQGGVSRAVRCWMKILRWVDALKRIGDTIAQYGPVHAALPLRFLLQVSMRKLDATPVGHGMIACLTGRYATLNRPFRCSENSGECNFRIYTAILKFLAKAIEMLDCGYSRTRL